MERTVLSTTDATEVLEKVTAMLGEDAIAFIYHQNVLRQRSPLLMHNPRGDDWEDLCNLAVPVSDSLARVILTDQTAIHTSAPEVWQACAIIIEQQEEGPVDAPFTSYLAGAVCFEVPNHVTLPSHLREEGFIIKQRNSANIDASMQRIIEHGPVLPMFR